MFFGGSRSASWGLLQLIRVVLSAGVGGTGVRRGATPGMFLSPCTFVVGVRTIGTMGTRIPFPSFGLLMLVYMLHWHNHFP